MFEPIPRLGDTIDDYCPRCRLLLNHAIASLLDGKVVKVICQTCHSEHPFRNAEIPQKKKPAPRQKLFAEVLNKTAPAPAATTSEADPPASEPAEEEPESPVAKKKASPPARYISRHKTRPPRGGH